MLSLILDIEVSSDHHYNRMSGFAICNIIVSISQAKRRELKNFTSSKREKMWTKQIIPKN